MLAKLSSAVPLNGKNWGSILQVSIVFGLLVVSCRGWQAGTVPQLTAALLLSCASLIVGGLLGFLFGIPRSLQHGDDPRPPADGAVAGAAADRQVRFQYLANTNLEQISDWLTKILVGVGLTQLTVLPEHATSAGDYFAAAIGGEPSEAARVAVAMIVFFTICGFLFSYLWTRLFLGEELANADRNSIARMQVQVSQVLQKQEEQDKQAEIDARAISLVNQFLTATDASKIPLDELAEKVRTASPAVRAQLLYQARDQRSRSWKVPADTWKLERTIPIFQALIAADVNRSIHHNHGQLGFALKDQRTPDLARAEEELSTAIELRGPARENGWELYEFNRAICRIRLDPQFREGKPSLAAARDRILADLRVARVLPAEVFPGPDIESWLTLNAIKDIGTATASTPAAGPAAPARPPQDQS